MLTVLFTYFMWEVAGFNFNCIPPSQLFPEQSRNLEKITWRKKPLIIKPGTEMSLKFKQSAFHSWYILQPMHI